MGFKLDGAPYNKDNMNIGVYRRDLKDGSAGKSNHTGIIVDKDVSKEMEDAVIAHETVHQHQQRNGELDYDENNFYWKGETYPREKLNEHNENLPWEKEAYKVSNGMLNGKNKDMKEKFKLKGYRGNNKPFKTLSDRGLIGAQDGAAAAMCTPGGGGGDECDAFSGKTKKKKFKKDRSKSPKRKGTIETKTYKQFKKDPGMEVAVGQFDSQGRSTGMRHSEGKSVGDFTKEVKKTNIFDSDIGERAAKHISRPKQEQTLHQTIKTKRNQKGKAKMQVTRTGVKSYDTRVKPEDMTVKKDRLVGKDKVRKYTTNPSRAQDNKSRTPDVKLVTEKKMRKLSQKATKKLSKGNPIPTKAKKPKSSKSSSIYM